VRTINRLLLSLLTIFLARQSLALPMRIGGHFIGRATLCGATALAVLLGMTDLFVFQK
jgi:hypothetical protein